MCASYRDRAQLTLGKAMLPGSLVLTLQPEPAQRLRGFPQKDALLRMPCD